MVRYSQRHSAGIQRPGHAMLLAGAQIAVRFDKNTWPVGLEADAGLVKSRRRTAGAFAGLAARIEAASPAPRIFIVPDAGAVRDRADMDVAVIDVPAVLAFGIAAASEGGHTPMIPRI